MRVVVSCMDKRLGESGTYPEQTPSVPNFGVAMDKRCLRGSARAIAGRTGRCLCLLVCLLALGLWIANGWLFIAISDWPHFDVTVDYGIVNGMFPAAGISESFARRPTIEVWPVANTLEWGWWDWNIDTHGGTQLSVSCPLWALFLFSLVCALLLRGRGASASARAGRCAKCGYDLRGTIEPRCPECGTPFERAKEAREAARP